MAPRMPQETTTTTTNPAIDEELMLLSLFDDSSSNSGAINDTTTTSSAHSSGRSSYRQPVTSASVLETLLEPPKMTSDPLGSDGTLLSSRSLPNYNSISANGIAGTGEDNPTPWNPQVSWIFFFTFFFRCLECILVVLSVFFL